MIKLYHYAHKLVASRLFVCQLGSTVSCELVISSKIGNSDIFEVRLSTWKSSVNIYYSLIHQVINENEFYVLFPF